MALVRNCHFFYVIIPGKGGQGNVFYNILERENAFLDYKNTQVKKKKKTGNFFM